MSSTPGQHARGKEVLPRHSWLVAFIALPVCVCVSHRGWSGRAGTPPLPSAHLPAHQRPAHRRLPLPPLWLHSKSQEGVREDTKKGWDLHMCWNHQPCGPGHDAVKSRCLFWLYNFHNPAGQGQHGWDTFPRCPFSLRAFLHAKVNMNTECKMENHHLQLINERVHFHFENQFTDFFLNIRKILF